MPKSKPKHSEEQSALIPAIERLLTEQTSTILEAVDTRLVAQEKRLDEHLAAQDQRIEARFAAQEKHIEERLICAGH